MTYNKSIATKKPLIESDAHLARIYFVLQFCEKVKRDIASLGGCSLYANNTEYSFVIISCC